MPIEHGPFSSLEYEASAPTRDKLLVAIARSAEELTQGAGWPDGVHSLLEDLGRITGVSRVWIFQTIELTANSIVQDYTFEWAARPEYVQLGMAMFAMSRREIDAPEYRDMVQSRMRGEWQKVLVASMEHSEIRENLELQGIKSMLTIPIMVEGQWWGTLGFDDCERHYEWTEVEIALLRTAAYLISNAVIRDRLRAKQRQSDILQSVTKSSAWDFDLRRGRLWCTSEILYPAPGPTQNLHFTLLGIMRLVHPEDRKALLKAVKEYAQNPSDSFRHDLRIHSDCGAYVWVEVIGRMHYDDQDRPHKLAGIAVDIIARKQREETLREKAYTDHLTGITNRASLDEKLQRLTRDTQEDSAGYALLLIDVDHFKRVNDTRGHATGDQVLRHIVKVASGCLRKGDTLARIGGEEFVALLPEAGLSTATRVGRRICAAVEQTPWQEQGSPIRCTVSVGAASCPPPGRCQPSTIMQRADQALYKAKKMGRNRVEHEEASACPWDGEH